MRDEAEVRRRAEALLEQMTLPEKVAQMIQIPYSEMPREEALQWAARGAGSFLHVLGDDAREVQRTALGTRLGIPVLFGIDAIHGHGLNERATIFPSQLACACAWSRALAEETGRITAREVATDGLHWTFSPVLCLGRDTRWGRVDETFGEDPYLAGELGAAIVRGYQGENPDGEESILACAKHYIGYGEAVGARDACDTEMTFRKLRETFLPPFQKAVEAGCATVMTAYGSIDGTPFTASRESLKTILRDELHFDGFVVTDWDNVQSLVTRQMTAGDIDEASRVAALAGNDMIMTTSDFYDAAIRLVREGRLEERVIDDAVRHILTVKLRMGLFETPEKKGKPGCIGCAEHLDAARCAARESVVLLKNDGLLPFGASVRKIAVIGPNADDIRAQYGDWTYFTHPRRQPDHTPARPYETVLEGMRLQAARVGAEIVYSRGCGIRTGEGDDLAGAVEAAKGADAIVLVVGDDILQHGEFKDRADLSLSGRQTELFHALRALGVPLVTVLLASKPLCMGDAAEDANAVLAAFNGGMFGGGAVAEILFGACEPQGRLPISFPRHSGQVPVYYNQLPGWHGGQYCDLPETPLFAFGEGLGYTRFVYENARAEQCGEGFVLSVDVRNAGKRDGVETVQAYVNDCVSTVLTPVKQLAGFQKLALRAGEQRRVRFDIGFEALSLVLPDGSRTVEAGAFDLMVGHSSKDGDLLTVRVRV